MKRAWNGPDVRGCKPITVYFDKWQDKDEVLRKAKLLKGASIYVGEDFSKRVKDQRAELQKELQDKVGARKGGEPLVAYFAELSRLPVLTAIEARKPSSLSLLEKNGLEALATPRMPRTIRFHARLPL